MKCTFIILVFLGNCKLLAVIAVGIWLNAIANMRPQRADAQGILPTEVNIGKIGGVSIRATQNGIPVDIHGVLGRPINPVDVSVFGDHPALPVHTK